MPFLREPKATMLPSPAQQATMPLIAIALFHFLSVNGFRTGLAIRVCGTVGRNAGHRVHGVETERPNSVYRTVFRVGWGRYSCLSASIGSICAARIAG